MRARIVENDKIKVLTDAEEIKAAVIAQTPIWVELESQSDECQNLLTAVLDLHPLTIEDIWATRTQPKLEDYRKYLYMIVHGVQSAKRGVYDLLELDIIIGKTFLVTHDPHGVSSKEVLEELERDPNLLLKGPAWVAHSLLDHAVDHYIPIIDQLDNQLENLIDDALSKAGTKHGNTVMKRILRYKRTLQTLRRMSVMQREIFLRLSRGEFEEIPRDTMPFFRDVHDHFMRVNDLIESYRDLVTSALEAYLSVQSNRMNEVMKTLTMISTVMLPLTFIAGLYGMNFKYMPELEWLLGYPFALAMMAIVSAGILIYFRHKGWLGVGPDEDADPDPKVQNPAKPPGTSKKV